MRKPIFLAAFAAACLAGTAVSAQTLRIALSSEPTAVDPHYHELTPNNALAQHIFDSLVKQDEKQQLHPNLASSWENDGKNRWTFKPHEAGCEIGFFISYEFASRMLGLLMGAMFDKAFRKFAEAFEKRAELVYGRNAPTAVTGS